MKTWRSTGGVRYRVEVDAEFDGSCDTPNSPRMIWVHPRLRGTRGHLETCIHEAYHAENPWASEEIVTRRARAIARFLWGIGYRLNVR